MAWRTDLQVVYMAKFKLSTSFVILLVSFTVVLSTGNEDDGCGSNCVNGRCESQKCVCDLCWTGHKCDQTIDRHQPRFVNKHSKIYISPQNTNWNKPIFTVKAYDPDSILCVPGKVCMCDKIIYKLNPQDDRFWLNSSSGKLFVTEPNKMIPNKEFILWISALSTNASIQKEIIFEQLQLKVIVQEVFGRVKRQAASRKKTKVVETAAKNLENFATSFSLRTVAGEVNTLQVGSSIHYKLEIALPRSSIDLLLEIHTKDSHSGNKSFPALSLYNFTVPQRVSGISFSSPSPQYFLSNKSRNVFDRLSIDFGSIKNTGPDRNVLVIYFSVVLTRKPSKAETKHAVTIGAEYGKGTFVWVAQSQITTSSQSEDQVHSNVDFIQFSPTVEQDSAAVFKMAANLEFRSDNLRVEITKNSFDYEPDNLLSLGRISVEKFGKNYLAIPNNSSHYISYREKTISQLSFSKSVLDMNVITNIGEKSRSFSNNEANILQFAFTVYAINYKENVGKNASFSIRIILGSKVIWNKSMNVTITERKQERSTARMLSSFGEFSSYNVSKGGLTQLLIRSKFSETTEAFVDFALLVEVPVSHRTALFIPCAAKFVNEQSSSNVPYLNEVSIKPTEESNQFTFTFGRIHFVAQESTTSQQDSTVMVEITFRVPFLQEIDDDTTLFANVKAFSGSKSMKVLIPHNEVSLYFDNKTTEIEVISNRSVVWEDFVLNGGIGYNLDVLLSPNLAFQHFLIRVRNDSQLANLPQLNICRISLVKVGMNLPCTCVQTDVINQNNTMYFSSISNSSYHNYANISLGSISVLNTESSNPQRKLVANIAMIIKERNVEEHELYPVAIDVIADNEVLWTEKLNLTIGHSSSQSEAVLNMSAKLNLKLLDQESITPGFTTNIRIEVLTTPNTMGPLTIEVISEDEELSVCGLWVDHIGENMPCINKEEKANYNSVIYGRNNIAKLQFDMITNFGPNIRRSETEERKANSLEFITMVRVSETAKTNKTIKIVVSFGNKNVKLEQELDIPVNGTDKLSTEFKKPKSFNLKTADGSNITYAAIGKLIYFEIELEQNSQIPITILLEPSNDYKICSSAFVKIGKNYPCYSASSLTASPGKFELGMICNTFLNKDSFNDNLLRLAVALKPNGNLLPERTFKVSSFAYVGSTPLNSKYELLMTVGGNYSSEDHKVTKGATVHVEVTDNIPIKIRERKWVPFNVRIPPFTTSQLTVHLQGDADDSRAVLSLHDLRILSGGSNIACPLENANAIKLKFNSSVSTSQTNQITADLGYFSNFGFSHTLSKGNLNESEKLQDDFLKMQVMVELTDHQAIAEDSVFKVAITTHFGDSINPIIRQGQIKLVPVIGTELSPKIDVNIKLKKKMEVLDRGDTFTLTAYLSHLPESTAEPINAVLRLFTPNFIEVIRVDSANTNELPLLMNSTDTASTDILFPWILFSDHIVVNFTIQIDPNNKRGYGKEEATLITPYRVMCEHFRLNSNSKSPCSELKHMNFLTKSSECNLPLGMESGEISDFQISASSAISQDFAPTNARPNSAKFWSPAIRTGKAEYLQIDFGGPTRVVRIAYRSIRGLRRVSSFHLLYSNDGRVWRTAANRSQITYSGEDGESVIKKPVEARFYRFVIDEIEASRKIKNQYVSIRLELYGCNLEERNNNITNQTSTDWITHFSDDPTTLNRHIAVDPYTNVIYFCDCTLDNHQMCYYSANGGQSWNIIGRSIDSVEGFELATGRFFAIDYQRPAYFSSNDGIVWTPIDYEQYNSTVSHSKFHNKIVVPQYHREDIRKMDIKRGNWRVNYDGLYYEDSQIPKAYWKNCCGLD